MEEENWRNVYQINFDKFQKTISRVVKIIFDKLKECFWIIFETYRECKKKNWNFILENLFQHNARFHFRFFKSHTKFYKATLFGQNIHFLVYAVTHCPETPIIPTCSLAVQCFFIVNEADTFPLTLPTHASIE